jgi:peroxidase
MTSTWGNRSTTRKARPARKRSGQKLNLEHLETRIVPDVRSITGFGNNIEHPHFGEAGTDLIRIAHSAYADGLNAPSGANRPNARFISNTLSDQTDPANPAQDLSIQNNKALSDFIYVFGQFLDHDLDLTKDNSGQRFDIPPGSPNDPMGTEAFTRSQFDPNTGIIVNGVKHPRQQIQADTSFIDGSQIYGSDVAKADALRTHSGGRLKDQIEAGAEFLPFNNTQNFTTPIDMANDAHLVPDDQLFAAGDRRGNETTQLISMHTLFLREHNRLADQYHAANPTWSDEQIYQAARRWVGAELEVIVYTEWLPALLGPNALPAYTGYKDNVNPGIANEFSTAMFRFAHSQLDNDVERKNNDGTTIANGAIGLDQSFFDPKLIHLPSTLDTVTGLMSTGIAPILKGAASANAQEVDLKAVRSVRNFLFGPPGAGGTDLIARDIQRGRDHGLTDYNSMRAAYGLPKVTLFSQISSDPAVQQGLQNVYGNVDNIDAFIGALAEDHAPGADVGPLTKAVLANQFTRTRDGDRFFYLNQFSGTELQNLLANASLSDIIERNTGLSNIQENVFFFRASISGTVFDDDNRNGVFDVGEHGFAGFTVNLADNTGVIATATTDANGFYRFTEQDLNGTGNYTVSVVVPSGFISTTRTSVAVLISRGDINALVNFGVDHSSPGGAAAPTSPSPVNAGLTPADSGSLSAADAGLANILVGQPQAPAGSTSVVTVSTPQASDPVTPAPDAGTSAAATGQDAAVLPTAGDPAPASSDSLSLNDSTANDPVVKL